YDDFRQQTPLNIEPSRPGAENVIAQFPEGVSRNVDDYMDTSLLEEIKKDGFFARLAQKYGRLQ
ncbi:MAG: hypothetical protein ACJ8DQ_17190, partial [Xanthobacteraceae bacterium]